MKLGQLRRCQNRALRAILMYDSIQVPHLRRGSVSGQQYLQNPYSHPDGLNVYSLQTLRWKSRMR
jgi:hypothetical protein